MYIAFAWTGGITIAYSGKNPTGLTMGFLLDSPYNTEKITNHTLIAPIFLLLPWLHCLRLPCSSQAGFLLRGNLSL